MSNCVLVQFLIVPLYRAQKWLRVIDRCLNYLKKKKHFGRTTSAERMFTSSLSMDSKEAETKANLELNWIRYNQLKFSLNLEWHVPNQVWLTYINHLMMSVKKKKIIKKTSKMKWVLVWWHPWDNNLKLDSKKQNLSSNSTQ